LTKHAATTLTALTGLATLVTALTTTGASAEHAAHVTETDVTARIQHLLHERLNGRPIGVVGESQFITDVVHDALLELRRVKITATATLAAGAIVVSVVIVLRQEAAAAQGERSGDHAQRHHTIQFHRISPLLVVCFPEPRTHADTGFDLLNAGNMPSQKIGFPHKTSNSPAQTLHAPNPARRICAARPAWLTRSDVEEWKKFRLERLKKSCSRLERGFLGFWRGFGEGAGSKTL
jgi:hypothetical protein